MPRALSAHLSVTEVHDSQIGRDQDAAITRPLADLWAAMREAGFWDCRIADQRRHIHRVTDGARRIGMLPERLLCVMKQSWSALPEVSRMPQRFSAGERRDAVISLCIDEYYTSAARVADADE